jgi:hypothetical protein
MRLQLNDNHYLTTKTHNKRVRLIVVNNDIEVVCRKETTRNLSQFLTLNEGRIFKGRLQLYKHNDHIAVEVKGVNIGLITRDQLSQLML